MSAPRPRRLSSELIIALSALGISLCALFVSVYEASVLSAQQRASVWPYGDVGAFYNADR